MTTRPADIVSSTSDKVLPLVRTADEARNAGAFVYDKPTPENAIMLFIDHQIGLMGGVRDFASLAEFKRGFGTTTFGRLFLGAALPAA